MDQESEDRSVPQSLRVVTVLDCAPGYADAPKTGLPIAILTLGHRGEVEAPMMLRLSDARRLLDGLIEVLEFFEPNEGDRLERKSDTASTGERHDRLTHQRIEPSQPAAKGSPQSWKMPSLGLAIALRRSRRGAKHIRFDILNGYRSGNDTMLIFRCVELAETPVEAVLKVLPNRKVQFKGLEADEMLPRHQWMRFHVLRPGKEVRIGERRWTKLSLAEVKDIVKGGVFSSEG